MIVLALIATLLVVALIFMLVVFYVLRGANELNKDDCGKCKFYDETLRTCWPKFETRLPGDDACDFYQRRDDGEEGV